LRLLFLRADGLAERSEISGQQRCQHADLTLVVNSAITIALASFAASLHASPIRSVAGEQMRMAMWAIVDVSAAGVNEEGFDSLSASAALD
jgi:hypothetical protein